MKVLIVDSGKTFQQLVSGLFENTGLEPVVASSGRECVAALEKEQFGFICITMHMEDTNGVELCKAIRQTSEHAYTPIILFTSEESVGLLNQAIAAGVTETFDKTRDIDQLVAYIKRFTLQHLPIEGRVLYVEDSRSLRLNTKEILKDRGLEVDGFSKAESAWHAFQQKHYDLVITDIVLAGTMSGVSLINKIRRMNDPKGDTPILAVTGFDDIARRIELFHMGINDYAIKPLIEEELIARVRYLISSSRSIERQLKLIRGIFSNSQNGMAIINHNLQLEQVNKAFLRMTGLDESEVIGKDLYVFRAGLSVESDDLEFEKRLEFSGRWEEEFELIGPFGKSTLCHFTIDSIDGDSSIMSQYLGVWRYRKELSKKQDQD